ncbi:MAG: hypothetical protein AB7O66_06600 [Limisphaerales bacterium]
MVGPRRRLGCVGTAFLGLGLVFGTGGPLEAATKSSEENEYYRLSTIPVPEGIVLEPGAIQAFGERGDRLAVSTRLGEIWFVDGAFADVPEPPELKFTMFASGLHEVLGLTTRGDGWWYATQRGEVTRLKDTHGDGRADVFETYSDGWGITGDYHEYAFGSKFDRDGALWLVLCLTGSFTSETEFRGWCLRVGPDRKAVPTVSGIRSPGGIATNSVGDMFYTDNQGPWNGTCWLKHLKPGGFVGNPTGNRWYSIAPEMGPRPKDPSSNSRILTEWKKMPEFVPPAVGFPYGKMGQSASGIQNDGTGGRFGPFTHQVFVGDQTWSTVMRVFLEQVDGVYQGACFPFREGLASGTLSLEFAPDGSLICGGTDRGWGSRGGKPFALQRLVWTGRTPFEIHEMRARADGFELTFTEPVDPATAGRVESYSVQTYTYLYRAEYGSPEVDATRPELKSAKVAADGRSIRLELDLVPGHIHELKLPGVRSAVGAPLLHPVGYYTLNVIPGK